MDPLILCETQSSRIYLLTGMYHCEKAQVDQLTCKEGKSKPLDSSRDLNQVTGEECALLALSSYRLILQTTACIVFMF